MAQILGGGLSTLTPCGPDLHEVRKKRGYNANQGTLANEKFKKACELAGVEPTKRQARKWNLGKGKAYSFRNQVK